MNSFMSLVSRVNSLPILSRISPSAARIYSADEQAGFLRAQNLAQTCAQEIGRSIQAGWTELQAASLMETWLRDHGVRAFFHKPFVWWGDRTRFVGVKTYWDYMPSKRALREGEVFILDVAPIVDGFVCDIGFSGVRGANQDFEKAIFYLENLREQIPLIASDCVQGCELWFQLDAMMSSQGYENIHKTYPFGVLGHRLHRNSVKAEASFIHFGWQSYWDLMSRGLFGQLLNKDFSGKLDGLWAIEPHIGGPGFGAKFEEILVVENGRAQWLNSKSCFHL
ncbi:MAG: M24 family metallopeptidase [Proteobacteria bacterium]|nr:M24 family metallopeptidase [Pseudomonadota bacterium]